MINDGFKRLRSYSFVPKINKNHNRQKMFRIGISVGRNDLNLEGHLQMGYNSKTIKNYKPVENDVQTIENNVSEPAPSIEE